MTRTLIGAVIAVMVPAFAEAQEAKQPPLADYVSFCLGLWEDAHDVPSKASALGLADAAGSAGASMSIGKTTMRTYQSAQPNHVVVASFTTFTDGKDWSCYVTLPMPVARADIETMEQVADLDGQITNFGPTIIGRWKMRQPRPPVLIRAIVTKTSTVLQVQKYQPAPAGTNAKTTP